MRNDLAIDCPMRLSVDEARARIVDLCAQRRLPSEEVTLEQALGRVLASDIVARHAIPPFANSAMDGYALRGADLPSDADKRFREIGVMLAGSDHELVVGVDECVRITTGAPLPQGADTVVIQENVRIDRDAVVVRSGEPQGANVRPAGEDYAAGETALRSGETLTAARVGVLASCGRASASVSRRLRVAVFATGDELVAPGAALDYGRIYDSNRFSIEGLLRGLGVSVDLSRHVRDDPAALRTALSEAAQTCDVIFSSGGVSAGEADHLPALVAELGIVHFWKVKIKPGMPFLCGEIGGALVFALPGNPVSSMATLLTLVAPGLRAMQGATERERRCFARLVEPIRKKHDRTEFLRARLEYGDDGVLRAMPGRRQGSGMQRGMVEADALIVVPADIHELVAGAVVEIVRLPGV